MGGCLATEVLLSFNPRARAGRDVSSAGAAKEKLVSIHAPARGATLAVSAVPASGSVSIHAPARGATKIYSDGSNIRRVSIHAPARGATKISAVKPRDGMFQSTRPRGARRVLYKS